MSERHTFNSQSAGCGRHSRQLDIRGRNIWVATFLFEDRSIRSTPECPKLAEDERALSVHRVCHLRVYTQNQIFAAVGTCA